MTGALFSQDGQGKLGKKPLVDSRIQLFARLSNMVLGSLSKDVFERRTSTGSEAFSLFICLDTTKFVLLSFFSPIKTIYLRVSTKPQPNAAKSQLPVDVRRSKTLLLKLPITIPTTWERDNEINIGGLDNYSIGQSSDFEELWFHGESNDECGP